jgi:hypothetical protein
MKFVQADELPWQRGLEHRGGVFHFRRVLEGEPGRIDNFQLSLGKMGGAFYSPRHRHNFEQIRYQVSGTLDYDRDGKMTPGVVGYFPEGVFYGPQSQSPDEEPMGMVLQFGGASGGGYLSRDEVKAGMEALADQGEFKNGVFRRRDDVEGKRNVDGYQAIWEHVNRRPMDYPTPRYSRPFLMDPSAYDWVPTGTNGVAEKFYGSFTERRTSMQALRLEAGASFTLHGRSIAIVQNGTGEVTGKRYRAFTVLYLDWDESAAFAATEAGEMLVLGLPDLRPLMAEPLAAAAE